MLVKIALGQMEVVPGRPDLNTKRMLDMVGEAREKGAQVVVFPEMAIPGYLLGDTWEQQDFLKDCEEYGHRLVEASEGICVLFGNVAVDWKNVGDDGRVRKYNAFFAARDGRLAGGDNFQHPFRIKTLQPNYREFDDTRHFYSLRKLAAEMGVRAEELLQPVNLLIAGERVPVGCILCEDAWSDDYAQKPVAALHRNGRIKLIVNISSSPFTAGKNSKRNRVYSRHAREAGAPLVYVNNVGVQNNGKTVFTFDGNSTVYNCRGEIIHCCPPFREELQFIDLDLDDGGEGLPAVKAPDGQGIGSIHQAVEYGIEKFLTATGINRVVVGVSGGVDSAVSACLFTRVLGPSNVLLANLPSIYNSATTRDMAARLAVNLGCLYTVVPIQESVDHTVAQVGRSPVTDLGDGRQFSLELTPFMVENVQARDRSSRVLAALASAFGGGFTCNANKSEITVGYTTLYGDMAGFFAVLADLWKHQVYEMAKYLNENVYRREMIPPGIISLVPSAELSPEQNVDEGRGDPLVYPYHDYLFQAFMEHWDRATPESILGWYVGGLLEEKIGCAPGLVNQLFRGPGEFIDDLERWWRLYTGMAVAKRIQAPPVLAVSRRAYGFDHREAQNGPYYSRVYLEQKAKLLNQKMQYNSTRQ